MKKEPHSANPRKIKGEISSLDPDLLFPFWVCVCFVFVNFCEERIRELQLAKRGERKRERVRMMSERAFIRRGEVWEVGDTENTVWVSAHLTHTLT